jgi:hypothetical protein
MLLMRALLALFALLAIASACTEDPPPTRSHAPVADRRPDRHPDSEDYAGGIAWHVQPPLVSHAATSPMRAAEYVVSGHPDTTLAVFHFGASEGGSVDDNINRWVDQFTQADGSSSRDAAVITHREAGGLPVTFVDVSGSFSGMRGTDTVAAASQRMLGAIVEGPEGLVFFKLVGPSDTVGTAADAFDAMLASIHPAG